MLGFTKREAKLEKAKCGRTDRLSGLNASPARALTILLCSHSLGGTLKNTHRIGNPKFWESRIQTARVSRSPFVLSVAINQSFFSQLNIRNNENSYLSLLVCPERENLMRPWHILLSYQQVYSQQVIMKGVWLGPLASYSFQDILINMLIAKWFQTFPVKRGFTGSWGAA